MTPMAYSPHHGLRIPTMVGLLLTIVLVGVVVAFFEWYSRKPSSASGSVTPLSVFVTNVTDTSVTIVWTTSAPATGIVKLAATKRMPAVYFDDRDTTGKMKPYTTHSVTIRSLTPATSYSFHILSNGKNYTNAGKPYIVTTASTLTGEGTGLEPAYGAVSDGNGLPVVGAIVLLTLERGQLLSTLTSLSGSWLVSLGYARTASLTEYMDGSNRLTATIRILYQNEEATAVTDTLNDAPVPTMILGKTYDFRRQQAAYTKAPQAILGERTTMKPSKGKAIRLTAPANNASLATTVPLIQGTGLPGKAVSVVVGITQPVSGTTTVGGDGLWRFTPPKPLPIGKQMVTATTVNDRGLPVAFTHTFTILKSGTQVLGEATPSATLEPTPTAVPSATPSPTPTPPLEGEPVPTSGTTVPTILILTFGASILASGFVLLLR